VVHRLLDVVLPVRCAACGRPGAGLCRACRDAAGALRLAGGAPVQLAHGVIAVAGFRYDGVVADAIRDVKTPGRHAAAGDLAHLLWSRLDVPVPPWPRTWVPSTRTRRRRRGADIPRMLAGPGAVALLRRVRQDTDQTALTAVQRRIARRSDFRSLPGVPSRIVLVDDVRTTGGTASAAAAVLQAAGAMRILVVTLAAVDVAPARNGSDVYQA
jgi:predicted amidophosphoribosyltransferase